jgi:hypothetical protein
MLAAMNARIAHTIAALVAALPIVALVAAPLLTCASGPAKPPAPPPPPEWNDVLRTRAAVLEAQLAAEPPAAAGEVVVRLAFEAGADLDLYVSDPREETVYYANTPARSGGALEADLRCPHATGAETVRFAAPLAGRYRIGVDFPHRCESDERVVPWGLSIDAHGERRILRGLAVWRAFASRVDEFVY